MFHGAQNSVISTRIAPPTKGLRFLGSDLPGENSPKLVSVSSVKISTASKNGALITPKCSVSVSRPVSQPRFIQHKKEAFWFYRFLSIVYYYIINPDLWTEDMTHEALEPADLSDRNMVVVDVGGGAGFTTLGIVKFVDAKTVTILDQSPHHLAKAKEKEPLWECRIIEGDAEDLPFETDYADRYVSAGRSIFVIIDFNCVPSSSFYVVNEKLSSSQSKKRGEWT